MRRSCGQFTLHKLWCSQIRVNTCSEGTSCMYYNIQQEVTYLILEGFRQLTWPLGLTNCTLHVSWAALQLTRLLSACHLCTGDRLTTAMSCAVHHPATTLYTMYYQVLGCAQPLSCCFVSYACCIQRLTLSVGFTSVAKPTLPVEVILHLQLPYIRSSGPWNTLYWLFKQLKLTLGYPT